MTNQVEYTSNGANAVFPFPFAISTETDCQVLIDGVVQSGDYSIRGQGSIDGGAVVFDGAPVAGAVITIRRQGEAAVSAVDSSGGYLADKLVAGTGISLNTITEAGGAQKLVVNAVEADGALQSALNLSDLDNLADARNNLDVYSKTEVANRDAAVAAAAQANLADLSGVTNVTAAQTKLDVYSKTEVANRDAAVAAAAQANLADLSGVTNVAVAQTKLDVYSKTEVASRDAAVASAAQANLADLSGVTNAVTARHNLGLDSVAYLNAAQDWTAPQRSQAVQTVSVGGSTVLSLSQYQNFNLTLTANITFANPASITADMVGQKGTIGITPAGFAIASMGSQWKRVGNTGSPDVITGIGRIDYHIRATDRIEYAYNDVEA